MQIFKYDYKTGKKGKKLADKHYSGTGKGVGISYGKIVHEHFLGKIDTNKKENQVEHFTADDFGVEAITCCIGCCDGKWDWIVVCSKDHAIKVKKRNLKNFGHEHYAYANFKL